jgi:sulfatase modifying factor 1
VKLLHLSWRLSTWARLLSMAAISMTAIVGVTSTIQAAVVTFGQPGNQFEMDFVTIGNTGNNADHTGSPNPAGSVGYTYGIGRFEVSEDMINKYNSNFGTANSLEITKDTRGVNKPATNVNWNEAARFVNWLNTSQGYHVAYKFTTNGVNDNIALWSPGDAGYDSGNRYRNSLAKYVLPSYNEWYKAAYYNPSNGSYYDYATSTNTVPAAVASGMAPFTAVYNQSFPQGPADVNQAGGTSPYGVMGMSGNVFEWEESSADLLNSNANSTRMVRGGSWHFTDTSFLSSSSRPDVAIQANRNSNDWGFRVVSITSARPEAVPEPSMMMIGTLFILGGIIAKRRMKK